MRRIKTLLACVLVAVMAVGVAFASVNIAAPGAAASSAAAPGMTMHRSFREASDIVLATCSAVYRSASGVQMSRFTVDTVYAGSIKPGTLISLPGKANVGESCLLYLGRGGGADYAEDEAGYVSVTDEFITVKDGVASCGGVNYSLSAILEDLNEQRGVLTVPAQSFYYNDPQSLLAACDEVVIGMVVSVEGPVPTQTRSDEKGESVISTTEQTFVTVKVENGMGGMHAYGDTLRIALSPAKSQSVINATDLTSVSFTAPLLMPKAGEHYVFMLLRSTDSKSDCLFAVNPYQGYVMLVGDSLANPYYNTAFRELGSINELAAVMNEIRGF